MSKTCHPAFAFAFFCATASFFTGCQPTATTEKGKPSTNSSDVPTSLIPKPNGTPAPEWSLKDLDGKKVSLSDFKGKVVVLDIWATWCEPCLAEIPHFIELQDEWKDKGATVVGMSIDSVIPADVATFAKNHGMNYPIVIADDITTSAYGADNGVPITVVIDKKGNIVATHLGITEKSVFEDDIKKALND